MGSLCFNRLLQAPRNLGLNPAGLLGSLFLLVISCPNKTEFLVDSSWRNLAGAARVPGMSMHAGSEQFSAGSAQSLGHGSGTEW